MLKNVLFYLTARRRIRRPIGLAVNLDGDYMGCRVLSASLLGLTAETAGGDEVRVAWSDVAHVIYGPEFTRHFEARCATVVDNAMQRAFPPGVQAAPSQDEPQQPQLQAGPVTEEEAKRAYEIFMPLGGPSLDSMAAALSDFLALRATGARP